MEVSKDVKPGISPIKFESFGATADNDMNEMTPKLVEGKVEIIEASAPEATPTTGFNGRIGCRWRYGFFRFRTAVSNANANGNGKTVNYSKDN